MHLRISPRDLGAMLVEPFCERCYFYKAKLNFKLPFDRPMPGILHYLDRFEKTLVDTHFAEEGKLPAWLRTLGCESTVEFPEKMTQVFPKYDITMVGMPDAVFSKSNGELCLVDFKTAMNKGDNDPFMPIYKTQLLGYTHLLESNGIGEVDSAVLIYFENQAKAYESKPLDLLTKQGFKMPFSVSIHEVEIDRSELEPLLKRFRKFADMDTAPEGLMKCKNCARLEQLFDIELGMRNQEDVLRHRDNYFRKVMQPVIDARRERARNAWDLTQDEDQQSAELEFFDFAPIY